MPIKIIMFGVLPGFISSTIRYSWATVAPPKATTVVIHEVFKFCRTLTKLSLSIECDASIGGCCMFTALLQVDRLKHAHMSHSSEDVLHQSVFLYVHLETLFFTGIFLIFLSGTFEAVFVGLVVVSVAVLLIVSRESPTLPVSSIVP